MRSISRVVDVSINTVSKLLGDAGRVCAKFHDENVRGVRARRVQMDEIWSFTLRQAEERRSGEVGTRGRWRHVDMDRARRRLKADRFLARRTA